jgi:hypothetical protein
MPHPYAASVSREPRVVRKAAPNYNRPCLFFFAREHTAYMRRETHWGWVASGHASHSLGELEVVMVYVAMVEGSAGKERQRAEPWHCCAYIGFHCLPRPRASGTLR